MDFKLLGLLAIFLIAALLPEAECWGSRRWGVRIRLRRPWKPSCKWTCPRVCTYYTGRGIICSFVCRNVCGRKKRGTDDEPEGHVTPIPRDFGFYDLNDDGFITMEEIETTLGEKRENCEEMFKLADTDTDGKLSLEEFENGPMVFENYQGDPDDDDDQGEGGENPGQGEDDGNPGQGGDDGNPGQGEDDGNPGQGGDGGNPGQGEDDGNPGQGGYDGNPAQGVGNRNPGNQGNNPGQKSIESDEE